jgi:hypothetical protein
MTLAMQYAYQLPLPHTTTHQYHKRSAFGARRRAFCGATSYINLTGESVGSRLLSAGICSGQLFYKLNMQPYAGSTVLDIVYCASAERLYRDWALHFM